MDNSTNAISASSAGNLISQQAVGSKQLLKNRNSKAKSSDSTSESIGDTLETSDREANGQQAYYVAPDDSVDTTSESKRKRSPAGPGNHLDLHG